MLFQKYRFQKLGAVAAALLLAGGARAQAPAPAAPAAAVKVKLAHTKSGQAYARTITAQDLQRHLSILASDSLEGRETGMRGQKMAADYIARHFQKLGLKPGYPGKSQLGYFQPINLDGSQWTNAVIKANGREYAFLKDFLFYPGADKFEQPDLTKSEVVFAGYGIADEKYNDYKTIEPDGRTVVILAGEPKLANGNYLLSDGKKPSAWTTNWRKKIATAKEQGAKQVFYITNSFNQVLPHAVHYNEKPVLALPDGKNAGVPVYFMPMRVAAEILKTDSASLASVGNIEVPKGKVKGNALAIAQVETQAVKAHSQVPTENVIGVLEGTDKKDEAIIITAHYDHIGIIDGKVYNGADDDGSGTSAVLELAEAFATAAKEGKRPKRTVIFCLFTGEEKGLLGSEYYSNDPLFPLPKTVCNLNIDMIGRRDSAHINTDNYVYVIGADKISPELHAISEEVNKATQKIDLDYTYNREDDPNRFYYRSDHYNFAKHGVPVIFYFNGVHADYHQHTDEADKIIYSKMAHISQLVFHTAWELANSTRPLQKLQETQDTRKF